MAAAEMFVEADSRSAVRLATTLISTATGADLDALALALALSRDKLPRKVAAPAVFSLYINRATLLPNGQPNPFLAGSLPAGTVLLAGGLSFALATLLTFAGPPITADGKPPQPLGTFVCSSAGVVGNKEFLDVTGFQGASALFDPTLSVVALPGAVSALLLELQGALGFGAATGGADPESDDNYRARFAHWYAGLDANLRFIEAGALGVPGVQYATAIEEVDTSGNPLGPVSVYVADATGRSNAGLVDRVNKVRNSFRLSGQRIDVHVVTAELCSLALNLAIRSDFESTTTQAAVTAAVVAYINALRPGDRVPVVGVSAIMASVPGVVFESAVPSGVLGIAAGTGPPALGALADLVPPSAATAFRTKPELISYPLT